jgi:porin
MADRMLVLPVVLVLASTRIVAYESEAEETRFTVGGVVSTAAQCGADGCFSALPLQPEMSLRLEGNHELFVKLGLAAGDGHNHDSSFNIAPWAADLESDVQDVNGRSTSRLLTAGYRYTANPGDSSVLESTFGLIDATDHLDDNAYSNDEYTQFMNSALVNGPNVFLPSYDAGFALSWSGGRGSVRGVYMNVGENDDGNPFHFVGVQLGYRADTALGEGNYRLLLDATDAQFYDPTGTSLESRSAFTISCDQKLGKTVGAFIRFGRQRDDAAIDYGDLYSGGIDLAGEAWGRERDNIGIGYAHLTGGNGNLVRSQVTEGYYRFAVNEMFSVTGDVQYMIDRSAADESPEGFILGLRLTAEF